MKTTLVNTNANVLAVSNTDMERAAWMVAKTKGNINPVVMGAKLAMLDELKRRLNNGEVVEFDYIKKSTGELRHAIGCLRGSLIATKIKGTGVHNSIYGNFTYFDLSKNQFRCASYETICRICA